MIIAFGHQRRRGKDSCSQFLEISLKTRYSKLLVRKRSFADSLKASSHMLYAWAGLRDGVHYENFPEEKEKILPILGKSPRDIWIDFGNAVRERVWRNTFAAKVVSSCDSREISIITDLRYQNEFDLIKSVGGLCVKVVRPDLPPPTDVADTALNACTLWDHVIINDGDLNKLNQSVDTFIDIFLTLGVLDGIRRH